MPVTCDFCGVTAPGDPAAPAERPPAGGTPDVEGTPPPLTWSTAVENGRTRYFCAACSREHLRAIESKLDSAWW